MRPTARGLDARTVSRPTGGWPRDRLPDRLRGRLRNPFRREHAAQSIGRLGFVARGVFYAVLAYLVVRIALLHGDGGGAAGSGQADAQGALSLVARTVLGKGALAVASLGFLLLGVVRLVAAVRDRRPGRWRRLTVAGQGLLYLALAAVPARYLAGQHSTGSERQQHTTARQLLGLPGGAAIVVIAGVAVVLVCAWQVRGVLRRDFVDGLSLGHSSGWVRRLTVVVGAVGITGRALVFVPVGCFLVVAGLTYDPRRARGLDGEVLLLSGHLWGRLLLGAVSLALAAFAVYSLLEARYRDLSRGV